MLSVCTLRRVALLSLTVLCACAAGEPQSKAPPVASAGPTGRFGTFLEGQFAIATHDLPFAADRLLTVVTQDPANVELKNQALLAAVLIGRADALRLARQLPANPVARLLLANHDAVAGNWAAAEADFRNLPRDGTTEIMQPLLVAWSQQGGSHTDDALNTLRRLTSGNRLAGLYSLNAAMIADQGGRQTEADRLYTLAATTDAGANLRLGEVLASWSARRGNLADANRILQERIGINQPLAIAMPALRTQVATVMVRDARDGLAETYLAVAAGLHQQQTEDFAQVLLQFTLDLRPDLTPARLLLADIQAASGRHASAMATLAPVSRDDPLSSVARLRRDAFTADAGHTDDAIADLRQMATAYPGRPEPLAELGDILRNQTKYKEAAAAYSDAILRDAPSAGAWRLFYQRGISYERAHDWAHAEPDLEHAVELAPDQASVLNYLGYAWADRGQHLERARQMLERAVQLQPNDGAIIDSLGWVKLRTGDNEGAVTDLERAVEMQPEDAEVNGHLGDAYWAAGRHVEAQNQWRRALNLHPNPDDAAHLESRLHETQVGGLQATQVKAADPHLP